MTRTLKTILFISSLVFNVLGIAVSSENARITRILEKDVMAYQSANDALAETLFDTSERLDVAEEQLLALLQQPEGTPATFTSYYEGDGSSNNITASTLTTADFQINSEGWYLYKGKVVLAASTYRCLNAKSGACGAYNTVPEGYELFSLHDEVIFEFNDKVYEGIILDSCGACFVEHPGEYQRLDIFVAKKGNFKMGNGSYRRVNK